MNYPAQRLTELQMRLAVTRQQIALPAAPNRVI